jgi:hypothetical protein
MREERERADLPERRTPVFAAYIAVTVVAAIAFASAAVLNFTHNKSVAETADRLGVPVSWQVPLGFLLAAGSLGLVTGFVVPVLGTAAACGLVLYFLCAAGAHIRARDTRLLSWINWCTFFSLAVAALVVGLVYRGLI